MFPYLPKELIHIILEYDGRIKYRRGKYIDIISKSDSRYITINYILGKKQFIRDFAEAQIERNINSGFMYLFPIDYTEEFISSVISLSKWPSLYDLT